MWHNEYTLSWYIGALEPVRHASSRTASI